MENKEKTRSQLPYSTDVSQVFDMTDCTESLDQFMETNSKPIQRSENYYFWPTEIDPHAAEVVSWIKENAASLFPNVMNTH